MAKHYYYIVPDLGRFKVVRNMLMEMPEHTGIVFCQTKKDVAALAKQLQGQFSAGSLHGDTPASAREKVMADWSNQRLRLLITTPAMGQGLGDQQVAYLINYQLPNVDAYVQTLAEMPAEDGVVMTLVAPNQEAFLKRLQDELEVEIIKHPECEMEFMEASLVEQMKNQGKNRMQPGKPQSHNAGHTSHKSKGNQPSVPTRHV